MESDDSDSELMAEAEELVAQAGLDLGAGVQAPQIHNPNDYDDDEDDYLFTLEEPDANGVKRKYSFHVRRIIHLYETLSPARFKAMFRMTKETFDLLFTDLACNIHAGRSNNGKSLLPMEKFLVYLYAMGSNSFVIHTGTAMDISEGTVQKCIDDVLKACFKSSNERRCFVEREIYLPEREEALRNGRDFLKKSKNYPPGFPPIFFGSLDGSHIKVSTVFQI